MSRKTKKGATMLSINMPHRPVLNEPTLIMGFEGWPNAGEISTGTIDYLLENLNNIEAFAYFKSNLYFDHIENRPVTDIRDGKVMELAEMSPAFSFWKNPDKKRDLILFSSPEPKRNWELFAEDVLKLAEIFGCRMIITLGGTYDYVPHWVEPQVSYTCSNQAASALLGDYIKRLTPGEYSGPASIHTQISLKATEKGVPLIGFWGHAPVYVQSGNVKLYYFMLEILKEIVGFTVNTKPLFEEIAKMERRIEKLVAEDPRLKEYLDGLREEYQQTYKDLKKTNHHGKVIPLDRFKRPED